MHVVDFVLRGPSLTKQSVDIVVRTARPLIIRTAAQPVGFVRPNRPSPHLVTVHMSKFTNGIYTLEMRVGERGAAPGSRHCMTAAAKSGSGSKISGPVCLRVSQHP